MNRAIVAAIFVLTNVVGPAMADCSAAGGSMSIAQIQNLLAPSGAYGTVYACYNNGTRRQSNETLINATQFQEYHNGGATMQVKGTYSIGLDATNVAFIKYVYTHGSTDTYRICLKPAGNVYQFYNTATNRDIPVVVSTGTNAC